MICKLIYLNLLLDTLSEVTDEGRGANCPNLWQAKTKTGPPLSSYFGYSIILVFSRLLSVAYAENFHGWV